MRSTPASWWECPSPLLSPSACLLSHSGGAGGPLDTRVRVFGAGIRAVGGKGFVLVLTGQQAMLGGGLFIEASGTFPVSRGYSLTFLSAGTLRTMDLLGSLGPRRSLPACPAVLPPTKETICGSLSLVIEKGYFLAPCKGFMGPGFCLCPWEKLE